MPREHESSCLARKLGTYVELSSSDRDAIARLEKEEMHFAADAVVRRRGEAIRHLFVVKSGWLTSHTDLCDGRRHVIQTYHAGDMIGLSDLASHRCNATLTACAESVLCPFPKNALDEIVTRQPRLSALMLALSARDQEVLIDLLRANARMGARERTVFLLLMLYYRLRLTSDDETGCLSCPLNQTQIGDMIGLTNVSVSKCLVDLERSGLIARDRHRIRLLQLGTLERMVEFEDRFSRIDTTWFPEPERAAA